MTLFETIFVRRSVRIYESEPLSAEELAELLRLVRETEALPGCEAAFRLIGPEEMGLPLAPHYLVASCAAEDAAYANLGFVLEKLDLTLQSRGLGSLWYGMNLPRKSEPGDAIVMAFGRTKQPPRRGEADFKRLPLKELGAADSPAIRAARLAPSSVNSQPWIFEQEANCLRLRLHPRGLLAPRLEKKLNKIDLGIAARHAWTALEAEGKRNLRAEASGEGRALTITLRWD
ncbi:MAG: hypothetical protein K6G17_00155 [Oscillospiraceae bacterium]|nr:hypothetical protein [Oscillospiraceae bacterium]